MIVGCAMCIAEENEILERHDFIGDQEVAFIAPL